MEEGFVLKLSRSGFCSAFDLWLSRLPFQKEEELIIKLWPPWASFGLRAVVPVIILSRDLEKHQALKDKQISARSTKYSSF